MTDRHALSVGTASSLALLVATLAHGDVYTFRVVAESGDPAPGSFGGSFTSFGGVSLNASGQLAFQAATTGPLADTGYWSTLFDAPQVLAMIVGEDYPVPGAPGVHFGSFASSFFGPHLNDAGNVGFSAPVGEDLEPIGIFRKVNGIVETIALPGQAIPSGGPGVTIAALGNLIAFSESNLVATRVTLAGNGVNASNDTAMGMTWFGGFQIIAREGNGAPGLPGRTFGSMEQRRPLIGPGGQLAFEAPLNGAPAHSSSRWRGWPGSLTCLVKTGDPTPVGGTFLGGVSDFWPLSLSATGGSFRAALDTGAGTLNALWHSAGGPVASVAPIAVVDAVGPLGFYAGLSAIAPTTTSDGSTTFAARFDGFGVPSTSDTALLRWSPGGGTEVLLREGDPAYGYGAGVEIDDLVDQSGTANFASTDSGWTLIRAAVRGPGINEDNALGLWTIDPKGAIHLIARVGTLLSLAGEPARMVWAATPAFAVGSQSGRRASINERGDVGLRIQFTNGDSAVVVAQLPRVCPADLNGDGTVDSQDLALLLGAWGTTGPVGTGGDVDIDGDTDVADLGILLGSWGPC